jgi:urocanate hydratase
MIYPKNGISHHKSARNKGAVFAIKRAMQQEPHLKVRLTNQAGDGLIYCGIVGGWS